MYYTRFSGRDAVSDRCNGGVWPRPPPYPPIPLWSQKKVIKYGHIKKCSKTPRFGRPQSLRVHGCKQVNKALHTCTSWYVYRGVQGRTHSTFAIPLHSMLFAVITHYASAGMQHPFCRLDHMCKEFSGGPLWQK